MKKILAYAAVVAALLFAGIHASAQTPEEKSFQGIYFAYYFHRPSEANHCILKKS